MDILFLLLFLCLRFIVVPGVLGLLRNRLGHDPEQRAVGLHLSGRHGGTGGTRHGDAQRETGNTKELRPAYAPILRGIQQSSLLRSGPLRRGELCRSRVDRRIQRPVGPGFPGFKPPQHGTILLGLQQPAQPGEILHGSLGQRAFPELQGPGVPADSLVPGHTLIEGEGYEYASQGAQKLQFETKTSQQRFNTPENSV